MLSSEVRVPVCLEIPECGAGKRTAPVRFMKESAIEEITGGTVPVVSQVQDLWRSRRWRRWLERKAPAVVAPKRLMKGSSAVNLTEPVPDISD
jgi:hypothetical protein